ncbi:MAG: TAXI family TRAP transporter solute-binding subunit [Chloroflexi bacterium]|nr:TAXI family TRAP transporter solute-binding subunit [Chloroflexota bacterium]
MRRLFTVMLMLTLVTVLALSACAKPTATTAPAATVTVTAAPAPAVTVTPTPAPAVTVTPAPKPAVTVTPTPAPAVTVTASPSPTPTAAPKPTVPVLTKPVTVRIGTLDPGSSLYVWGAGMAEIFKSVLPAGSTVDVLVTAGGIANVLMVNDGRAEISFGTKAIDRWSQIPQDPPFKEKLPKVNSLAPALTTFPVGFYVAKATGITSVPDMIAKRYPLKLLTFPIGSGGEVLARMLLGEFGITYDDIKRWGGSVVHTTGGEIGKMMKDGTANGVIAYLGTRHPIHSDVFATREMVLLPISGIPADNMVRKYGYGAGVMPGGAYKGVDVEVPTLTDPHELAIGADVPADVAYILIKALVDNQNRLVATDADLKAFDPKTAWRDPGAPLHPGAARYYKEAGFMP